MMYFCRYRKNLHAKTVNIAFGTPCKYNFTVSSSAKQTLQGHIYFLFSSCGIFIPSKHSLTLSFKPSPSSSSSTGALLTSSPASSFTKGFF